MQAERSQEKGILCRQDAALAVVLAIAVLSCGWLRLPGQVCGAYHDDAIYVTTAKALAEGRGYRLINLPGSPPQTKYPILYPSLLATIWKVWPDFPANLLAMQLVTLSCGAAAIAIGYLYLVRFAYTDRWAAFAAGLALSTAPTVLFFATQTMSEMPFALLLVLALWQIDKSLIHPPEGGWRGTLLGVLMALPFLCRTIGIALIPISLWLLWRNGRPWKWTCLGAAMTVSPLLMLRLLGRVCWSEDPIAGYYTDYFGAWVASGLPVLGTIFVQNSLACLLTTPFFALDGAGQMLEQTNCSLPGTLILGLGLLPVVSVVSNRGGQALPSCLAVYLTIVCAWPFPPYRFLVPVAIFLLALMLHAVRILTNQWLARPYLIRAATVVMTVIVSCNLVALEKHYRVTQQTRFAFIKLPERPVAFADYHQLFAWLSEHSRDNDIIACGLDTMVFLYTGRQAFRPFIHRPATLYYGADGQKTVTVTELERTLKRQGANYLVRTPLPGFEEEASFLQTVDQLHHKDPIRVRKVFVAADERFCIFRLDFQ